MSLLMVLRKIKKEGVVSTAFLCAFIFIFTADSSALSGRSNILYVDSVDAVRKSPDVNVSLTLKGMKNSGIDESSFTLKEDGQPVEKIVLKKEGFSGGLIYLIISIDASKSISPKELSNYKKSAKGILDSADDSFKIGIWKFNDDVVILKDFTGRHDDVSRLVDSISRQGKRTKLYDAIYDGIDRLSAEEGSGKSLIVFTDGKDEGSGMTADDVVSFAAEKRISVHFITIKSAKTSPIERIARRTGGSMSYAGNTEYSGKIIRQLKEYGDGKYTLEYHGKKSENRNRKLEIFFKNENISDRALVNVQYPEPIPLKGSMMYLLFGVSALAALLFLMVVFLLLKVRILNSGSIVPQKKECPVSKELFGINAVPDAEEESALKCRGWLLEKDGPETGKKYPIFWKNITIGRDPSNGIVINDIAVSAKHLRIRGVKGAFYIVDLASENGTYLNGKKLLRVKKLSDWDEIKIGRTVFIFRTLGGRV
jgi:hypothetical protein